MSKIIKRAVLSVTFEFAMDPTCQETFEVGPFHRVYVERNMLIGTIYDATHTVSRTIAAFKIGGDERYSPTARYWRILDTISNGTPIDYTSFHVDGEL